MVCLGPGIPGCVKIVSVMVIVNYHKPSTNICLPDNKPVWREAVGTNKKGPVLQLCTKNQQPNETKMSPKANGMQQWMVSRSRSRVPGSWSNERGAANATAACASNEVGAPAWICCSRQPSPNRASHLLAAGMRGAEGSMERPKDGAGRHSSQVIPMKLSSLHLAPPFDTPAVKEEICVLPALFPEDNE